MALAFRFCPCSLLLSLERRATGGWVWVPAVHSLGPHGSLCPLGVCLYRVPLRPSRALSPHGHWVLTRFRGSRARALWATLVGPWAHPVLLGPSRSLRVHAPFLGMLPPFSHGGALPHPVGSRPSCGCRSAGGSVRAITRRRRRPRAATTRRRGSASR